MSQIKSERVSRRNTAICVDREVETHFDSDLLHAESIGNNFSAFDTVPLPHSGFHVTRLAMGSGTRGDSHTRRVGFDNMVALVRHGTERGLNFWDMADDYKSHPVFRETLKFFDRSKIAILTKSSSLTADGMRSDIDRFRKELNTDYIDVLLMHAVRNPAWATDYAAIRDVISDAREKGLIRTFGLSIHDFATLQNAVDDGWAECILTRINHMGIKMDDVPEKVVPVIQRGHANGKFMVGMKILGQGQLVDQKEVSLKYVLSLGTIKCFTIGFESIRELDEIIEKIAEVRI